MKIKEILMWFCILSFLIVVIHISFEIFEGKASKSVKVSLDSDEDNTDPDI